jgi:hypothetical protein
MTRRPSRPVERARTDTSLADVLKGLRRGDADDLDSSFASQAPVWGSGARPASRLGYGEFLQLRESAPSRRRARRQRFGLETQRPSKDWREAAQRG